MKYATLMIAAAAAFTLAFAPVVEAGNFGGFRGGQGNSSGFRGGGFKGGPGHFGGFRGGGFKGGGPGNVGGFRGGGFKGGGPGHFGGFRGGGFKGGGPGNVGGFRGGGFKGGPGHFGGFRRGGLSHTMGGPGGLYKPGGHAPGKWSGPARPSGPSGIGYRVPRSSYPTSNNNLNNLSQRQQMLQSQSLYNKNFAKSNAWSKSISKSSATIGDINVSVKSGGGGGGGMDWIAPAMMGFAIISNNRPAQVVIQQQGCIDERGCQQPPALYSRH